MQIFRKYNKNAKKYHVTNLRLKQTTGKSITQYQNIKNNLTKIAQTNTYKYKHIHIIFLQMQKFIVTMLYYDSKLIVLSCLIDSQS